MHSVLQLPLLDFVDNEFPQIDLSNCLLIASQNLLGSTETIIDHLLGKGLDKNHISIIGKSYSSSSQVIKNLKAKGLYVSPYSTTFDPELSFDQQYENYIYKFISERASNVNFNAFDKIIILDEGHKLLQIAENFLPANKLIGIEQSSKHSMLRNLDLKFPCVTISRTKAKLFIESPMIAEVVNHQLLSFIQTSALSINNVLIIGSGLIGQSIAKDLRSKGYSVKIFDHHEDKSELTETECNAYIPKCQVIVSCVYGNALKEHHYNLLANHVILASASLSDRAFRAVDIRKQYAKKIEDCHEHIAIDHRQGKLHLMNCGFPVNFSGQLHSVSPHKIQLTRALLLGAIYEGVSKTAPQIEELSVALQNKIVKEFFQLDPDSERGYHAFKH